MTIQYACASTVKVPASTTCVSAINQRRTNLNFINDPEIAVCVKLVHTTDVVQVVKCFFLKLVTNFVFVSLTSSEKLTPKSVSRVLPFLQVAYFRRLAESDTIPMLAIATYLPRLAGFKWHIFRWLAMYESHILPQFAIPQ